MLARELAPARAKLVEVGERHDVIERRAGGLRPLLLVLDEHADGLRVLEDVQDVAGRARRVDRRADGADERQREVEQRPLEARPAEQRERLAPADAEGQQPVRELLDGPSRLRPRNLAPVALDLVEVGRVAAALGDRVPPEVRDRAGRTRACFAPGHVLTVIGGTSTPSANSRDPSTIRSGVMRTTWNGSISFGLVNIPVGLAPATKPAARQSDVAFRQLHRECLTPIRQKRWCPVHDVEVDPDELVRGWEVSKGQFVFVEDADLEALETRAAESSRTIDITSFVHVEDVDPIYFDRTYFLVPAGA